jgi:preprotein translocase subunit YajC
LVLASLLLADDAGGTSSGTSIIQMIWPFALMFVVLYFLLIRPQQKRQKSRTSMIGSLKKGDKVVTIGGLHGTIHEINDQTVVLRVNDVTKMTFDRSAINSITQSAQGAAEEKKQQKEESKKEEGKEGAVKE